MLFFGWAVGAVVLGIISDKYGRRSVMFPSITAVIVVTFVMSFAHAPWVILLYRFIVGFFEAGSFLSMFVLATELVGPQKRALSGTLVWFYFTAALMIMALTSLLCAKLAHLVFNLYLTLDFRGDFVEVSDNQLF